MALRGCSPMSPAMRRPSDPLGRATLIQGKRRVTILALRNQLVDLSTALVRKGLNRGTAGNASIRVDDDSFLITPSGVEPHAMRPADTVMMEMDGRFRGERSPV